MTDTKMNKIEELEDRIEDLENELLEAHKKESLLKELLANAIGMVENIKYNYEEISQELEKADYI